MIQPALMEVPFRSRIMGLDAPFVRLGQNPSPIRAFVFDRRGNPVPDILIAVLSDSATIGSGLTDSSGSVAINVEGQKVLPEGPAFQKIEVSERGLTTVDFHSRERVAGPAVTVVEGLAAGGGIAMLAMGMLIGTGVHRTVGDVFVAIGTSVTAAAAFSAVARRL
jgi:hypothetical protein